MKDETKIVALLDASGSMSTLLDSYIEGYNSYIASQKSEAPDDKLTLIFFDSTGWGRNLTVRLRTAYENKALKDIEPLNRSTYTVDGGTPLYDALGSTIDSVGKELAALPEHERPSRVLIVTQTDGEENASLTYTKEMVKRRIEHQKTKYNWEFLFLSADEKALEDAKEMGVSHDMALAYESNAASTKQVFMNASGATTRYRASK